MLTVKSESKVAIYDYDSYRKKSLLTQIDNVLAYKGLLEQQREVLSEYYKFISIGVRIKSLNSILAVLKAVRWFGEFIYKPFNEATKEDIINFIHDRKRKGNSRTI